MELKTYCETIVALTRGAMREGLDGSTLMKGAMVGVLAATDPDNRIQKVESKITLRVHPGELNVEIVRSDLEPSQGKAG